MPSLEAYLDQQLARGRAYFSRAEALQALGLAPQNLAAAVSRLIRKRRLANPRHGFYLILRPEDRTIGAPDPVRWIDPLMKHQGIDYRISLLRAAAFHGSTGQATMVFQLIVPKQLRGFEIGRHRLQFIYQAPHAFAEANRPEWLAQMKSEAGFASVAGVELTLLDCAGYLHRAAGINGVAQIAKDLAASGPPEAGQARPGLRELVGQTPRLSARACTARAPGEGAGAIRARSEVTEAARSRSQAARRRACFRAGKERQVDAAHQ
jgi:hypothetical protein